MERLIEGNENGFIDETGSTGFCSVMAMKYVVFWCIVEPWAEVYGCSDLHIIWCQLKS